jgi:hypothetical protein
MDGERRKRRLDGVQITMTDSEPANVSFLKQCWICGDQFFADKRSARICRRPDCRMMFMDFATFLALRTILERSHWAGGLTEAEQQQKYYRERLSEGVRQLPHSAAALGEVLIEITEELLEA